jgi:hypothetical protein
MPVEFLAAMQTPLFLAQIRPVAAYAVQSQQVEFFVKRQVEVFSH